MLDQLINDYVALGELVRRLQRENKIKITLTEAIPSFQIGDPKYCYFLFQSPNHSDETSFLGGLNISFLGVSININFPDSTRRSFPLEQAVEHKNTSFDDVTSMSFRRIDKSHRKFVC